MPRAGEKRASHKPDCQCVVCKNLREKASAGKEPPPVQELSPVIETVPEATKSIEPVLIPAGSLKPGTIFEFNGQTLRAGHKDVDFITATDVVSPGSVVTTLGLNTMVRPVE